MEIFEDSQISEELAAISIDNLSLTPKAHAALRNARIATVGDILETERGKGLLRVRNLGKAQYLDIQRVLSELDTPADEVAAVHSEEPAPDTSAPEAQSIEEVAPEIAPPLAVPEPSLTWREDKLLPKTVVFVDYEHWVRHEVA